MEITEQFWIVFDPNDVGDVVTVAIEAALLCRRISEEDRHEVHMGVYGYIMDARPHIAAILEERAQKLADEAILEHQERYETDAVYRAEHDASSQRMFEEFLKRRDAALAEAPKPVNPDLQRNIDQCGERALTLFDAMQNDELHRRIVTWLVGRLISN